MGSKRVAAARGERFKNSSLLPRFDKKARGMLFFSETIMHNSQKEHLYKVLVVGDLGVGKTSIIKRYVHQNFSPHYRATIGVDFALKVLNWDSETVVRLQLWDIAGKYKH
nr:PREDICTED: ras-related protein Rab-38 isoform X1 [Latimeria chalumnae]|eukprot:XP_005999801.1 PREDICTED: ras-related protein Rab-38 isoform X1 [Latimeria chalumnae]